MSTSSAGKSYHHGSLREALVDAGLAILAEGGDPAALSLREAARRAGVSAMAPYRHFPDKDALLGAIARVGFERLATRLAAADASARDDAALVAQGEAYVAFALAEPALFRLMFGAAIAKLKGQHAREDDDAFGIMSRRVAALVPPERCEVVALHCWALAHGLACLVLDGQIAAPPEAMEGLIRAVLDLVELPDARRRKSSRP